ncbi:hypothetical protein CPB83DRAFT_762281 [Crepidotus variabilis]|uniref:DUF4246 domain-containing protein n=1 Tax=Crepidotus variabilis TaxID=179855 RepID=A0A9P6JSF9_9AGAR|nr:hypothetical protein CPB83DRAFT_762281 [Crepidotus variabilis]
MDWFIEELRQLSIYTSTSIPVFNGDVIKTDGALLSKDWHPGFNGQVHEQWETEFLKEVYGCTNFAEAIQEVGGVQTRQGRLITFPNILQHRVQPFNLEDPSKPGHRKTLALFLVDPYIEVLRTAKIPPQRVDWWAECFQKLDTPLSRLPMEIRNLIFDQIKDEFPM